MFCLPFYLLLKCCKTQMQSIGIVRMLSVHFLKKKDKGNALDISNRSNAVFSASLTILFFKNLANSYFRFYLISKSSLVTGDHILQIYIQINFLYRTVAVCYGMWFKMLNFTRNQIKYVHLSNNL